MILSRNIILELFGGHETKGYITTKHFGSVTSCDSLVRVCISVNTSDLQESLMRFTSNKDYWLYLAEVIFYSHNSTCSPDAIFNSTTLLPPDTTDTTSPVEPSVNATQAAITQPTSGNVIIAAVVPLSIVLIIVIIVVVLVLCIVCTTKHKHQLRAKEDHTTTHRQTHSHQPPHDRGHSNLCEETGQAYYSSLHTIRGEDVPADQVNHLDQDTGPVRGGTKPSRGATVDKNEAEVGAYSTVSYSKQPQASKEAGMEDPLLYAQVNENVKKPKKKSENIFATDQQEEASASALYAQVDEKKKKKRKKKMMKKEEDTQPRKPDQLYAQAHKKKKDSTPPEQWRIQDFNKGGQRVSSRLRVEIFCMTMPTFA